MLEINCFVSLQHQNATDMKKTSLLILGLVVFGYLAKAQNVSMDFIPFHYPGYDIHQFDCKVMQQSDGNLIANVLVALPSGPGFSDPPIIAGNTFFKVSPNNLQVIDSLFLADSNPPFYTFLKDPRGQGNLRINIEPEDNGGTALRISRFSDDNLQINLDEDVVVHLYDSAVFNQPDDIVIDSQNDLIVKYYTSRPSGGIVCHIARYGLDGTLKHTNVLPEIQNYLNNLTEIKSHPKQYYQWKTDTTQNMYVFVIDSIFNQANYYVVNRLLEDRIYFEIIENDTLLIQVMETYQFNNPGIIIDDGDLVIAAPYTRDSAWVYDNNESGMVVARYDLRTMQRKAIVHFNDWPGPSTYSNCLGFQKAWNGDLYLVYREPTPQNMPTMTTVKMDRNLNVIWKRYCYEPGSLKVDPFMACSSDLLYDVEGNETGIYIAGYSSRLIDYKLGLFFFFLNDEGLTTVQNGSVAIRPYTCYPNPTHDMLHLQYSPDVQPAQIEIFDLQGRLVHSQHKGLERLSMEGLPSGTYTLRVTMQDGNTFSDKVVKN